MGIILLHYRFVIDMRIIIIRIMWGITKETMYVKNYRSDTHKKPDLII